MTKTIIAGLLATMSAAGWLLSGPHRPGGAQAAPLCQEAVVSMQTTVQIGPECIPYGGAALCQTTTVTWIGAASTVLVCIPAPFIASRGSRPA
jgi:hypothetical protein